MAPTTARTRKRWATRMNRLVEQAAMDVKAYAPAADDARSLVRAELKTLSVDVTRAMAAVTDRATRAHLDDGKDQIAKMLDPKFVPEAPATATPTTGRRRVEQEDPWEMQCWPDYGIYGR